MIKLSPKQHLLADIAGRYGLDNLSWEDRMLFTLSNMDRLEELTSTAKEPILYISAVKALRDIEAGKPTGYCCMFDASASGTQILSILTGDSNGARISNVTGSKRSDPYTAIYEAALKLGMSADRTRKETKQAIMTSLYGSEKEPEAIFGNEVDIFYKAMEKCVPLCWELNQYLLKFLKTSTATSYDWIMPDGFNVHCPVTTTEYYDVSCLGSVHKVGKKVQKAHSRNRSLSANLVHSVEAFTLREVLRRCNVSDEARKHLQWAIEGKLRTKASKDNKEAMERLLTLAQESGYLSARVIGHLDGGTAHMIEPEKLIALRDSLPVDRFPIKSVHDCVAVHPNYAQQLLAQYREVYAQLNESQMLQYLLRQILKTDIVLNIEPLDGVRESHYSFS